MKTIRRDKLMRLARAGRLVCVESYHFDDILGSSRSSESRPVTVVERGETRPEGTVCLFPSDFTSGSGGAYESGPGLITLHVHSNSNFTFREKPCQSK